MTRSKIVEKSGDSGPLKSSDGKSDGLGLDRDNDKFNILMNKFDELNENIGAVKNSVGAIEAKLNALTATLDTVKNVVSKHTDEIRAINFGLDELEQYGRRVNLRFLGVPEANGENTDLLILDVVNKMKVNITINDIERSHRLGKPGASGRPRPIIVRFSSYRIRAAVFAQKRMLKGSAVVVQEDLTRFRYMLLKKAVASYGFGKVWTADGRFFLTVVVNGESRRQRRTVEELYDKLWIK